MIFNGKPTKECLSRDNTSSPTASLVAIFETETIDAYGGQYIMVLDVTRTFIQTNIPTKKDGKERAIKKITGVLVEMILELDSETYSKRVVYENGKEVIYVVVLRSIYGMILE